MKKSEREKELENEVSRLNERIIALQQELSEVYLRLAKAKKERQAVEYEQPSLYPQLPPGVVSP